MSLPARDALLVLDWGVGGFGVLRAIRARERSLAVNYLSDAGFTPYGRVPAVALARRLEGILQHFHARGTRRVVLACNAASTVVPALRLPAGLTLFEVIGPGVELARAAGCARVGILGGARTVRSGEHRRRLAELGIVARGRVAQPLSAYVERGELDSAALHAVVRRVVAPLRREPAVLLACTHYPAIAPVLQAHLPGVLLLDPAAELARRVCPGEAARDRGGEGPLCVLTTGSPRATREAARRAFGVETGVVRGLEVHTLKASARP